MNSSIPERSTRILERAAVLAGVREDRERRRLGRRVEVRVGEDDVRGLAAELERDPLDRLRGPGRDRAPDLGRAGEGDLGDVGVLYQPPAAFRAGSGDDVEHALGEPGVEGDPLELERGQRRQLGRLEHDRVPAASAGATFHEAITSGKFHGVIRPTTPSGSRKVMSTRRRPGSCGRAAAPGPRRSSGSTRPPSRSPRGRRRSACRRCGLERRQLLGPRLERVREPPQRRGAVGRGHVAPCAEGRWRRRPRRPSPRRPPRGTSASTCSVAGSTTAIMRSRAAPGSPRPAPRSRGSDAPPGAKDPECEAPVGDLDRLDQAAGLGQPLATSPAPSRSTPW